LFLEHIFDIRLPESNNDRLSKSKRPWNPATFGHQNTDGAGIRRHPITVAECRLTKFKLKLAGIRPDLTESGN